MAILRITSRPAYGQIVECDRELVIGRADADVVVDDAEISGRHAVVRPLPDGIEVEDLGSLNGTFVDDERITGPTKLTPGVNAEARGHDLRARSRATPSDAPALSARDDTAVRDCRGGGGRGRGAGWPPGGGPPGGGPPGGGPPGGGPPGPVPPPIRMLMKTAPGRRLLPLLARLPQAARGPALLLLPLLIVGLIVLALVLLL